MVLTSTGPLLRLPEMEDAPVTEAHGAESADLDLRSTAQLVALMNREDARVPAAVAGAAGDVAAVVDEIVPRLGRGGRLVYVGAGTSGYLAEMDAGECEATFGTSCDQVVAVIAGGDASSTREREAAEDDAGAGAPARDAL